MTLNSVLTVSAGGGPRQLSLAPYLRPPRRCVTRRSSTYLGTGAVASKEGHVLFSLVTSLGTKMMGQGGIQLQLLMSFATSRSWLSLPDRFLDRKLLTADRKVFLTATHGVTWFLTLG